MVFLEGEIGSWAIKYKPGVAPVRQGRRAWRRVPRHVTVSPRLRRAVCTAGNDAPLDVTAVCPPPHPADDAITVGGYTVAPGRRTSPTTPWASAAAGLRRRTADGAGRRGTRRRMPRLLSGRQPSAVGAGRPAWFAWRDAATALGSSLAQGRQWWWRERRGRHRWVALVTLHLKKKKELIKQ
jgi:hypothetical protein